MCTVSWACVPRPANAVGAPGARTRQVTPARNDMGVAWSVVGQTFFTEKVSGSKHRPGARTAVRLFPYHVGLTRQDHIEHVHQDTMYPRTVCPLSFWFPDGGH